MHCHVPGRFGLQRTTMTLWNVTDPTLFQLNGQVHLDSYVQKFDLQYIGYFNIQGLDAQSAMQVLIG